MEIIITRHGQSEENHQGIIQGRLPGRLSEVGRNQAEKLGERLSQEKIDIIYCSPTFRCQETSNIIKKHIDPSIPLITSELIQEIDYGQMSGKKWEEIDFKNIFKDNEKNKELGIETLDNVHKRIKTFLEEIKTKHYNQTVLIIGHSLSLKILIADIFNKDYHEILDNYKISNASVSIFKINKNITSVIINETDFLK